MSTPAPTALDALQALPLAVWIRSSPFGYPLLEIVHIAGIGLLLGTVWLVDMRLLGLHRALDARVLARIALPWTLAGFAVVAASGSLMFMARAGELIANRALLLKLLLVLAAGINAAVLHARGGLGEARSGAVGTSSAGTRAQAALSIALWLAAIGAGRWIAYV
jgi:hypothetical protein